MRSGEPQPLATWPSPCDSRIIEIGPEMGKQRTSAPITVTYSKDKLVGRQIMDKLNDLVSLLVTEGGLVDICNRLTIVIS